MEPQPKTTHDKVLQINLDKRIYGTFAEIGAGQEVGNWFFKVGASAGTIAKTMSAYDMTFSDNIYGESKRYVSRERLGLMLEHEYDILIERLSPKIGAETTFFCLANTVRARGYQDTGECHGWMGIRFQRSPNGAAQDVVLHLRLLDDHNVDQQEALGIVGANLVYAAFFHGDDIRSFTESLVDGITPGRVEIDMLKITGDETEIDNRLCSLQLVQSGLTDAAFFASDGEVMQPAEKLYKKPLLLLRGRFDPVTNTHIDMLESATTRLRETLCSPDTEYIEIMELTMNNLFQQDGNIDHTDFLRRADILQELGKNVLISKFPEFHRLAAYLSRYSKEPIGIVLGTSLLEEIFEEKWYETLDGGILESFGRLFKNSVRLLVYPEVDRTSGQLKTAKDAVVANHLRHLLRHLTENSCIDPIVACQKEGAQFSPNEVRKMMLDGDDRWRDLVPSEVAAAFAN